MQHFGGIFAEKVSFSGKMEAQSVG